MIIPWSDLPYSFMSQDWLDAVDHVLQEAETLGLEVWIWDDWIFPSGFGGGEVTRNPRYMAKALRIAVDLVLEPGDDALVAVPARTVAAGVFPVDKFNNPSGGCCSLAVEPGSMIRHKADERQRLVVIAWQFMSGMQATTWSHGQHLQPDVSAEECDIYTHDDRAAFSVDMLDGDATRKFIELIHERYWARSQRHFGNTLKGFFYDEPHLATARFPWSEGLFDQFQQRKGYDVRAHLVLMMVEHKMNDAVFDLQPESVKRAKSDYTDVWSSLAAENFFGVLHGWCQEHGVLSAGHISGDESIADTVSMSGMFFKDMAFADVPGIDIIWDQLVLDKFNDAPRMAGSQAALYDRPFALSESFAVQGHGLHLTEMRYVLDHQVLRGINKFFTKLSNYNAEKARYFHPPELSAANPMMAHYGDLLHERLASLCALLNAGRPIDRVGVYVPADNFYRADPEIAATVTRLARTLTYSQREYDYVWDGDLLAMDVREGRLVSPAWHSLHSVVIPAGAHVSQPVLQKLHDVDRDRVIVCEPASAKLDGIGQKAACPDDLARLVQHESRAMAIRPSGLPISVRTRLFDNGHLHFMLNESAREQVVDIEALETGTLAELDLAEGEVFALGDGRVATVPFLPGESKLILLDTTGNVPASPRPRPLADEAIELKAWTLTLPDDTERTLPTPLPSWTEIGWGGYSGFMRYRSEFQWDKEPSPAVLTLGDVRYAATVYLDGQQIGRSVFTPHCLRLEALSRGAHRLEIDVLNTLANSVFGDPDRYEELKRTGAFKGTYAPIYEPLDRARLRSGLLGPLAICPLDQ